MISKVILLQRFVNTVPTTNTFISWPPLRPRTSHTRVWYPIVL